AHVLEVDLPGLLVDGELDDTRRIRAARRRPDTAALELPRALRRRGRAREGQPAVQALAEVDRPRERYCLVPIVGHTHLAVAGDERRRTHLELLRDRREDGATE